MVYEFVSANPAAQHTFVVPVFVDDVERRQVRMFAAFEHARLANHAQESQTPDVEGGGLSAEKFIGLRQNTDFHVHLFSGTIHPACTLWGGRHVADKPGRADGFTPLV